MKPLPALLVLLLPLLASPLQAEEGQVKALADEEILLVLRVMPEHVAWAKEQGQETATLDSLIVLAQGLGCIPEEIKTKCSTPLITHFTTDRQAFLKLAFSLIKRSLGKGDLSQIVQGKGNAPLIANFPVQGQTLLIKALCLRFVALQIGHLPQNVKGNRGSVKIPFLAKKSQAFQTGFSGLLISSQTLDNCTQVIEAERYCDPNIQPPQEGQALLN